MAKKKRDDKENDEKKAQEERLHKTSDALSKLGMSGDAINNLLSVSPETVFGSLTVTPDAFSNVLRISPETISEVGCQ